MQITRKESSGVKQLFTGIFSGTCRGKVNPTNKELADMFGYDLDTSREEAKYESKNEKGEDIVTVSFWLQADTPEKPWFNARFRLVDKKVVSEKQIGEETIIKTQYVNAVGGSSWIDKKENLLDWFTHFQKETVKGSKVYENIADKYVRESIQGEADLYNFLKAYLSGVSWFDPNTNILIDVKKMFRNVDKYVRDEYQPLVDAFVSYENDQNGADKESKRKELLTGPVVCLATVYTGEKDGKIVHYQNLYREFLPGYIMKKISFALSTNNWTAKEIKKWYEQLTGEHGSKDSFTLSMLQPFDPENHIQATNATFKDESGDVADTSY